MKQRNGYEEIIDENFGQLLKENKREIKQGRCATYLENKKGEVLCEGAKKIFYYLMKIKASEEIKIELEKLREEIK